MVAVGLFAARLGGRALWLVPASFVTAMALAGAVGITGFALPHMRRLNRTVDPVPGGQSRSI